MHIPDGLLNVPTMIATGAASAAGVGTAVKKVKDSMEDHQVPLFGVMAAFIFAAQMINFPVAMGTSGHLIGAFLSAVLLGPWATILVISAILIIQSLLFGDGGVLALGANIFNMALVANFTGYYVYQWLKRRSKKNYSGVGLVMGGWASVAVASIACSLEIAFSGRISLGVILPPMIFWHTLIGIGEGFITLFLVGYLSRVRQDLIYRPVTRKENI